MKNILIGSSWKILSCVYFALINITVRYLTGGSPIAINSPIPVYTLITLQYFFGLLFFLPWYFKNKTLTTTNYRSNLKLNALRIVLAMSGIFVFYLSLKFIPVTQVIALGFLSPIVSVIGAVLFLKEKLTLQRTLAILISIIGSYLILRPDINLAEFHQYGWYCLLPIIAAALFAMDKILVRQLLNKGDSAEKLTLLLMLTLALANIVPLSLQQEQLYFNHIFWLLLLGCMTAVAMLSFNKAYQYADVTSLMPIGVVKILCSALLSYLIFKEIPNNKTVWLGITLLFASPLLLLHNIPNKLNFKNMRAKTDKKQHALL